MVFFGGDNRNQYMQGNIDKLRNEAWNHVLSGEYDKAIVLYQDILPCTNSIGEWNNAGTTYLLRDKPADALSCFLHVREFPLGNYVSETLDIGVALCCQGRYEEACADWEAQNQLRKNGTISYYYKSEAAYVLCLIWSVATLVGLTAHRTAAEADLKGLLGDRIHDEQTWRGDIARYVMSEMPTERLVEKAQGVGKRLASRKLCQACYYIAVKDYSNINTNETSDLLRTDLRKALYQETTDCITEPEYHLSRHFESQS